MHNIIIPITLVSTAHWARSQELGQMEGFKLSEVLTNSLLGASKEPALENRTAKAAARTKEKNTLYGRRDVKRTITEVIT